MTVGSVCKVDRTRKAALGVTLLAGLVATLALGCSEGASPSTSVDGSKVKSTEAAIPSPARTSQESSHKETHPAEPTAGATTKSGNVTLQPVTPEDFKKIIAAQKGKVVLVDFWATWCGPCREKFPQTLALGKKYASQGLTLVSVSMDSPDPKDQEKALGFLEQQNAQIINLANKMDDSEAAFGAFDIDGGALPHYKVFDRKGNAHWKFGGDPDHPFNEKDIERAVLAALKAQ